MRIDLSLPIDGVDYPAVLAPNTIKLFAKEMGYKPSQTNDVNFGDLSFDEIAVMIYCAIKVGCYKQKLDFPYTKQQMLEIAYLEDDLFERFLEAFTELGEDSQGEPEQGKKA